MKDNSCHGCNENEVQTPIAIVNPPGLEELRYRLGTHPHFLQTMKNRLANLWLEQEDGTRIYPLRQLTTRDDTDPAIALLDAWATVCDVLTFYQERIANEGYLGTATERRSILELAKLVGYQLKPGVAATAYLAFLLEDAFLEEGLIPEGTAAQSVPGPGETPQTFETAEPLRARTVWNQLRPLPGCLPNINSDNLNGLATVYFAGLDNLFKLNDPLLFQFGPHEAAVRRIIAGVTPEPVEERTAVALKPLSPAEQMPHVVELTQTATSQFLDLDASNISPKTQMAQRVTSLLHTFAQRLSPSMTGPQLQDALHDLIDPLCKEQSIAAEGQYARLEPWVNQMVAAYQDVGDYLTQSLDLPETAAAVAQRDAAKAGEYAQDSWLTADLIDKLTLPQAQQPPNSKRLTRDAQALFSQQSDLRQRLLQSFYPRLQNTLYSAIENSAVFQPIPGETGLQAVRPLTETAVPFGANAPLKPIYDDGELIGYKEWELFEEVTVEFIGQSQGASSSSSASGGIQPHAFVNMAQADDELTDAANSLLSIKMSTVGQNGIEQVDLGEAAVHFLNSAGELIFNQSLKVEKHQVDVSLQIAPLIRLGTFLKFKEDFYDYYRIEIDGVPDPSHGISGDAELEFRSHVFLSPGKHTVRVICVQSDGYTYYLSEGGTAESTEAVVFEGEIFVHENKAYSLLLIGDETHIDLVQLENQWQHLSGDNGRLRFINMVNAPQPLNIKAGQGKDEINVEKLSFLMATDYFEIDSDFMRDGYEFELEISGALNFEEIVDLESLGQSHNVVIYADKSVAAGYQIIQLPDMTLLELGEQMADLYTMLLETEPVASLTFDFVDIDRLWRFEALSLGGDAEPPEIVARLVFRGEEDFIELPPTVPSLSRLGHDITFLNNPITIRDRGPARLPTVREAMLGLDGQYSNVQSGDWVVIERPDVLTPIVAEITAVHDVVYTQFNLTARATELTLSQDWLLPTDSSLADLRKIIVQIFSGAAELAPHPIDAEVQGDRIVLDGLYEGLESGRWIVVTGERTDVTGTSGVMGKELMMLAGVEITGQGGDTVTPFDCQQQTPRTSLLLADGGLAYTYKRDTVLIYGNVVKATHGETRQDVLGSGNASQLFQKFSLKQKPLTFVPALNPSGVESSLEVRVNDVRWPEVDSLVWLAAKDRGYITQTDNEDVTTIIFGDGKQGARLPTGQENVSAVYRYGIGQPGNVKAEQIKLLSKRPLGVSGVINPIAASGGANRERRAQARQNAPLGVMALDRLVSVQDYADFARTFAGIDKADAVRVSDGQVSQILLTIAGADDIPIDENSDLFQSLYQALHDFGEPHQPILLKHRQRHVVVLSADIQLLPDYLWEAVEPVIRATLLDRFSFMRRQLGQPLYRSEITAVIQQLPGVSFVDINVFDSINENEDVTQLLQSGLVLQSTINASSGSRDLQPAQIAYLSNDIEETIILNKRP